MTIFVIGFLWLLVAVLAAVAARQGRSVLKGAIKGGLVEFMRLIPRIAIGVLGSGFIAEIMPEKWVATWLGPESGLAGIAIATLAGGLTPGGPMIGFAVGIAALKAGAASPQVVAYSTAWALFALHRALLYEIPLMPARIVWLRMTASVPLPFIAAYMAMLVGKP
ncbi:hypothetical protein GJW-30_1_00270 [Variibacter gotjawalensis]|uniref:Permease n=1 Tax=Variibacter gotjawalensis TaxID=1333996 RepID=A0A0S3PPF5_9BRAD|nr:hypothetical protein [Variibacter gotjawalensis]NIK48057.1 uncharacterized membrane protein YraQ (UPF0718 family) [Variibacter gotjawalensis]RZS49933.1 hypothetical protein EV661_2381 [Variibacter gotjawalensis]BAT57760.1 hypothetical protein GJW-30_1_00270 [Variibacter gotjawalensis]